MQLQHMTVHVTVWCIANSTFVYVQCVCTYIIWAHSVHVIVPYSLKLMLAYCMVQNVGKGFTLQCAIELLSFWACTPGNRVRWGPASEGDKSWMLTQSHCVHTKLTNQHSCVSSHMYKHTKLPGLYQLTCNTPHVYNVNTFIHAHAGSWLASLSQDVEMNKSRRALQSLYGFISSEAFHYCVVDHLDLIACLETTVPIGRAVWYDVLNVDTW